MQNTAVFLTFSFLPERCENQGTIFQFNVIPMLLDEIRSRFGR